MRGHVTALLAALVFTLTHGSVTAQPPPAAPPQPVPADGTEVFRWLLHARKIEPITIQDFWNRGTPGDVIVIILGDPRTEINGWGLLQRTAVAVERRGGALLIASDQPLRFGDFLASADGLEVDGSEVEGSAPGTLFREKVKCPYVVPRKPPASAGPEWNLFVGLDAVATNQPSFLRFSDNTPWRLSRIAGYPAGCRSLGLAEVMHTPRTPFAVAVAGPTRNDPHRFLALADPSVFINQMLIDSPDNLTLATRTVEYLQDPDGVNRKKCLFIQNGVVVTKFDTLKSVLGSQLPPIPLPSFEKLQEKLVDFGNQAVDKLQENNALNRAILGGDPAQQNATLRKILTGLLVVGSVFATLFVLRRLWVARHPTDIPPPPPGGRPVAARGDTSGGVYDRRQRELLRRNNLYEPVRTAVREMFSAANLPADAGPKLPAVAIAAAVRRPDTLRAALADLWKIAFGPPKIVTVQQWTLLGPLFERVRQAHADGKWRFAAAGPDAAAAGAGGKQA